MLTSFVKFSRVVLSFTIICGVYAAMAIIVHAQQQQGAFVPLSDIDKSQSQSLNGIFKTNDLSSFVNGLFIFAISMGGIIAVGRIIYGGWLYMMGDSLGKMGHAREIFKDVAIGILLLLSIYLILKVINPCILNLNALQSLSQNGGGVQTCAK